MFKTIMFAIFASAISAMLTRLEYQKKIEKIERQHDASINKLFIRTHGHAYIEGYQRAKLDNVHDYDAFPLTPKE